MMEGRNSIGNTIQLLNSGDVAAHAARLSSSASPAKVSLPSLASAQLLPYPSSSSSLHHYTFPHHSQQQQHHHHHHQRLSSRASSASSASSTPASPRTPLLERSGSNDSRTFGTPTPSPLTPPFGGVDHPQRYYLHPVNPPVAAVAKMDVNDPHPASLYPPIPDSAALPLNGAYSLAPQPLQLAQLQQHQQQQQQQQLPIGLPMQQTHVTDSSNSPVSEPSHVSNASTATATSAAAAKKSTPKKNQYPCPMAKQVGCTDFFTTSGHAARHAKKHTGKKDAFCPECNKAFTRKDNMEQHRRTHQNGRGARSSVGLTNSTSTAASTTAVDESKVKKSVKPSSKKTGIKAEPQQLEAAVEQQLAEDAAAAAAAVSLSLAPSSMHASLAGQMPLQTTTAIDHGAILLPPSGPYFLGAMDTGPIPALPNTMPELNLRPSLHRSSFATSLDYVPPLVPPMGGLDDPLHFSYPSPGLSNGLNSLALAASERRRLSEDKASSGSERAATTPSARPGAERSDSASRSASDSADATPMTETPNEVTP